MSVRKVRQKDRNGRLMQFWIIDVLYRFPDGARERVRRVAQVQNRRGAEREEREIIHALASGTDRSRKEDSTKGNTTTAEATTPLFREFATRFLDTYATTNNKPSEVQSKETILRVHLTPAFGPRRLDEIGAEQIEVYKAAKLKRGLAPKTVNNQLTVLRRLFVLAVEWRKLEHVPAIKWLKVPDPEFDFLTFEEADRLIAAPGDYSAMITVAARTGLRLGELLALRWDDVDLTAGRLVVRRAVSRGKIGTPKSGKSREVPLSAEALRALRSHRHLRGELVFCAKDGSMLAKGETKWPLWSACRKAGLRRIGWHVLRHTFASHLTMRGAPIKAVQELLGHSTIEMTMRYAHLSPDARRDAVLLLDLGHGKTVAKQVPEAVEA
ncbi:MAG: site-specific integrase [Deltaproteobacteria bacterium]|nr:site-specific integrase [Deltaproteobacteria bacterium]